MVGILGCGMGVGGPWISLNLEVFTEVGRGIPIETEGDTTPAGEDS